ncbi:hypothetical protein A4A49_19056 [Nicotiana attenuata]|uniref:Uncharacterized protein n=1 Tax=Nicotiana attenuata TaxID=49451 RepID=A0A1J6IEM6_NICAT|nr:hypothetical protein A4A49_19056 [Nicotiana attenuata]
MGIEFLPIEDLLKTLARLNSALQNAGTTEDAAGRKALGKQVEDGDVTGAKNVNDARDKAVQSGEAAAQFSVDVQQATLSNSHVLKVANDPALDRDTGEHTTDKGQCNMHMESVVQEKRAGAA